MPSLKSCIPSTLSKSDRTALTRLIKSGKSDQEALATLKADVIEDRQEVVDRVEEEGGTVARKAVTFEAAPDPEDKAATAKFNVLTPEVKRSVTYSTMDQFIPLVMERYGVTDYQMTYTNGGYLDEVNPSVILSLPDSADAEAIGRTIGQSASQQSVIIESPDRPPVKAVKVHAPTDMSIEEQTALYDEIRAAEPAVTGFTWNDGLVIGNYTRFGSDEMTDEKFAAAVAKATKLKTSVIETNSDEVGTNDHDSTNNDLKEEFQRIFKRQTLLHGAVRYKDDSGRENGSLHRPPVKNGQSEVTHFSSTKGLTNLDPAFYGTGMKGAEAARTNDDSWVPRVYFGFEPGTPGGYVQEVGVGGVKYKTQIPAHMMYDIDSDPEGLLTDIPTPRTSVTMGEYDEGVRADNDTIVSRYEKAIYDAGYLGYWSNHPTMGLLGVSFENLDVKEGGTTTVLHQSSVALRRGRETLKKYGIKPGQRHNTRQVAAAMEARTREKSGTIARDDRSPEAMKRIARWMVQEVKFEMEHPEHSGVGWYSEKYQRALDAMEITDKGDRDTFTVLLAITSDGQKVGSNFKQAWDVYTNFKKNGRFTGGRKHQRQASIDNNLEILQGLYDTLGPAQIHDYLMQEKTVSELKAMAKKDGVKFSTDYTAKMKLPMAALVLGPKLGAFYGNLMGAHGYLTMDRWWSRTINRYRGTLLQKPTRAGLDRFKQLMGNDQMSDDEVLVEVIPYAKSYESRDYSTRLEEKLGRKKGKTTLANWEKLGSKYPELLTEDTLERAANTIYKAAYVNLEDAPFNGSDREFMVNAVNHAQKSLAKSGVKMTVADIQATLWYYEKRLYGEMGTVMSADVSYEDAALAAVNDTKPKATKEPEDFLVLNQSAWHGTPHTVDKFSTRKIGTGEGAQVYGYGLYFASNRAVGEFYRNALSEDALDFKGVTLSGSNLYIAKLIKGGRSYEEVLEARIETWEEYETPLNWGDETEDEVKASIDWMRENPDLNASNISRSGNLYHVELTPEDHEYINHDQPFSRQPQFIQDGIAALTGKSPKYITALEMTGGEVYNMVSRNNGGDKEASELLHTVGVRGVKFLDGSSRAQGGGSYNYVIFHDDDVEITEQYDQFERGRIYLNDTSRTIQLTQKSDLSSFLHESGHLFLEMQKVWSKKYGVTDNQKAILDWLGLDSFDDITVEEHEKWAETFEVYLRTGKAPSLGLRRAFSAFARWLKVIYRTLTDPRLQRAQLDPEITDIFDRLLATADQIAEAAANPEYDQFFQSKEQAGMSDAQWAKYQKQAAKVSDEAEMTLDEKALKQYMAMKTKEWKEEREPLIEEERERLALEPIYQIKSDLKPIKDPETGETIADGRFDTNKLRDIYGDKLPDKLAFTHVKEGGIDPALYAEAHGYPSAKEMLDTLIATPALKEAATEAAQARMVEKHGDIINDGTLEQEAKEALVNEEHAKLLMMEIKASKKPSAAAINREYLKAQAALMIGSMSYKEIKPNRFYRAMIKAAQDAVRLEDPTAAKIQQLSNHYLYQEAVRVKDQMEKHRRFVRAKQLQKGDTKSVDPEYAQKIKMLAEMYDMRLKPEERIVKLNDILSFFSAQVNDVGGELTDLSLLDPNLVRAVEYKLEHRGSLQGFQLVLFDDLTAEDLRGVVDMLRHLRYVGGQIAEMNGEEAIKARMQLIDAIRKKGGKDHKLQRNKTRTGESARRKWNHLVNTLPSLANMIRKLDGNAEGGMAFDMIYQLISGANDTQLDMQKKFYDEFEELMGDVSKIDLARDDAKVFNLEDGSAVELTSEEVFMMALYWGTESSQQAVLDGWNMSDTDAKNIISSLTPDQLQLVNTTWAMNEMHWPDLRDAAIEMVGFSPPKLDAVPFVVNGVQMTGGHMQLFYDSQRVELANEQESARRTSAIIPTKAGSLNARVGSGGMPVLLDINNITRSVDDKIHYIAFAKAGRKLRQLLNHQEIKVVIERKHGMGFYQAFIESVEGITGGRLAQESHGSLAAISRWMRSSATMMHLAYSIRNTVQQIGALPISLHEVGVSRFVQASAQFLSQNRDTVALVNGKSKFMENRAQTVNRESREFMKQLISTNKVGHAWEKFKSHGFMFQTAMDSVIAYPTWLASYNKSMESHGDEARARTEADTAVAESVGSGSDMHLGRIMQSNQSEFVKTLTVFGSWFNAYYQRLYKSSKGGEDFLNMSFAANAVLLPMVVATISQALIMDGPDSDEDWVDYGFKNWWTFMIGTIPVIREIASLMEGFSSSAPISTLPASLVRIPGEIKAGIDGRQSGLKTAVDVGKAVSAVGKVPASGQILRVLDYIDNYMQGKEDGFNPYQMVVEGRDKDK